MNTIRVSERRGYVKTCRVSERREYVKTSRVSEGDEYEKCMPNLRVASEVSSRLP